MLRISESGCDEMRVVRLEGKLLEPWVEELRSLFAGLEAGALPADVADGSHNRNSIRIDQRMRRRWPANQDTGRPDDRQNALNSVGLPNQTRCGER